MYCISSISKNNHSLQFWGTVLFLAVDLIKMNLSKLQLQLQLQADIQLSHLDTLTCQSEQVSE